MTGLKMKKTCPRLISPYRELEVVLSETEALTQILRGHARSCALFVEGQGEDEVGR